MSVTWSFSKMFEHLRKRDRSSQAINASHVVVRRFSPQAGVAFPHDAVRLVDKCAAPLARWVCTDAPRLASWWSLRPAGHECWVWFPAVRFPAAPGPAVGRCARN